MIYDAFPSLSSGWSGFGQSNRGTDARNKNERTQIFFEAAWQPVEDIHI